MRSLLMTAGRRLKPAGPVVVIAALLAFIPTTTCILRLALRVPCPACGLTRAGLALLRLDLAEATRMHPLALPLTLVAAAAVAGAFFMKDAAWERFSRIALGGSGAALVLVWVARFLGLFGGPAP